MTCTVPRRDTPPADAFTLHRPLNDPLFRYRLRPLLADLGLRKGPLLAEPGRLSQRRGGQVERSLTVATGRCRPRLCKNVRKYR